MKKSICIGIACLSLSAASAQILLASASASDSGEQARAADAAADDKLLAQLMQEGAATATTVCAACHGTEGQGMVGPPLRQNVENVRGVVRAVVQGSANMPPIGAKFTDREIAAVVTYVRNSWGNKYGPVTEQQAAEFRL